MTRTLSVGLAAHVAGHAHTVCRMLRLDLQDGTSLGFTDRNRTTSFDLGDGAIDYRPDTGVGFSDLALSVGFEADDVEITGPISETITRTALRGGRFDDAVVRCFKINRADLSQGAAKLVKGYVTLAEVDGDTFKLTVQSEASKFSQTVGRLITAFCDHDFGVGICDRVPVTVAATVTAVTDARSFTVSFSGSYADTFFKRGTVRDWTTGALTGIRPVEIASWTAAGVITLWTALPEAPQIGDTLTVRQGCYDIATNTSKTREACIARGGDAVPFGGFPDVPGSDQVLRYGNPGSSG